MHFISGKWQLGVGEELISYNPATNQPIWQGHEANATEIEEAIAAARKSLPAWSQNSLDKRIQYLKNFEANLIQHQTEFAEVISQETGKPLWESRQEVASMIQKIDISITAFQERCPDKKIDSGQTTLTVHHKPHGVVAIFGPFNFPGHLPNGHIVPALLAGNTVVFKGSELTPKVSEKMLHFWEGLPEGVLNLVQGGAKTGHLLASHPQIDGLFFTGSYKAGMELMDCLKGHPEKILALEMGGNNPLVVSDVADLETAAYLTIQSAFLTSGQRCTCARRLIVLNSHEGDEFLKVLLHMSAALVVGAYTDHPEPFMGPVISQRSAENLLNTQATLGTQNGISLLEMHTKEPNTAFLSAGIMDVTHVAHRKDEEIFGPFLQVIRVASFEAAIDEANRTSYGLVASVFTRSKLKFQQFYQNVKAGVINWNTPTTGSSGKAPFGGVKKSGNHHPSGYYAADYCAYPVASMESEEMHVPKQIMPGITFLART